MRSYALPIQLQSIIDESPEEGLQNGLLFLWKIKNPEQIGIVL